MMQTRASRVAFSSSPGVLHVAWPVKPSFCQSCLKAPVWPCSQSSQTWISSWTRTASTSTLSAISGLMKTLFTLSSAAPEIQVQPIEPLARPLRPSRADPDRLRQLRAVLREHGAEVLDRRHQPRLAGGELGLVDQVLAHDRSLGISEGLSLPCGTKVARQRVYTQASPARSFRAARNPRWDRTGGFGINATAGRRS